MLQLYNFSIDDYDEALQYYISHIAEGASSVAVKDLLQQVRCIPKPEIITAANVIWAAEAIGDTIDLVSKTLNRRGIFNYHMGIDKLAVVRAAIRLQKTKLMNGEEITKDAFNKILSNYDFARDSAMSTFLCIFKDNIEPHAMPIIDKIVDKIKANKLSGYVGFNRDGEIMALYIKLTPTTTLDAYYDLCDIVFY